MSAIVGSGPLDRLLKLLGDRRPSRKMMAIKQERGVSRSSELRRIEQLRRRVWRQEEIDEAVEVLTAALRLPHGQLRLWPLQAMAIAEIVDNRGALLPIPAGDGKAFISILCLTLLDDVSNPLLLVPAHLRKQTNEQVLPLMRKHWRVRDDIEVRGYSELSLAKNAEMLQRRLPGAIILDECHYVRNKQSGRGRRMVRYMKENPGTVVVALSGTITQRSIKDYAHILEWTHGALKTPLPTRYQDLDEWALALDEGLDDDRRVAPGALSVFCAEGESVAKGFQRRLMETPGVVFGDSSQVSCSLTLSKLAWPAPPAAQPLLQQLRDTWTDPNGDAVMEAVDMWRKARQLSLGFWLKWDPPAPRDWLDARVGWNTYVRNTLEHNKRKLDTPRQVAIEAENAHGYPPRPATPTRGEGFTERHAAYKVKLQAWETFTEKLVADLDPDNCEWWLSKKLPDACPWCAWMQIRDTFKPNTVAEWIDDSLAQRCAEWAREHNGIVWVENPVFGERVAQLGGFPYFGAGDEQIIDHPGGPIAASLRAHGTGRNLQDRWSKMLFTSVPSSALPIEQGLARCHRANQREDEVQAWFLLGEDEQLASFEKANQQAEYVKATIGTRQRLLYANRDF